MSKILYVDTDGTKGALPAGTLGYDAYAAGGDEGRVAVGTAGGVNIPLAKKSEVEAKQDTLVSGTNIKTVNGTSLLGSGNITTPVTTINDTLTSTSITEALSAAQGKVLKDGKVTKTTMADNRAVRANGTTGEIQDSNVIIDDNGNVSIEADSSDARKFNIMGGTGNKQGYIFLGNGSVSNTSYGIISDQSTLKIKKAAWNIPIDSDLTTSWTDLIEINSTGKLLLKAPAKIGYGAGSGGGVTQVTSKTTSVTINTPTGRIITHNAELAAGASVKFTVNNSLMDSLDSVTVHARNFPNYEAICTNVATGNFTVKLTNTSGGSLSEAVGITFNIYNGSLN